MLCQATLQQLAHQREGAGQHPAPAQASAQGLTHCASPPPGASLAATLRALRAIDGCMLEQPCLTADTRSRWPLCCRSPSPPQTLAFNPCPLHCLVRRSVEVDGQAAPLARAGDSADVTLASIDTSAVAAGSVLCHPGYPVPLVSKFEARVVVLDVTIPVLRGQQVCPPWQLEPQALTWPAPPRRSGIHIYEALVVCKSVKQFR